MNQHIVFRKSLAKNNYCCTRCGRKVAKVVGDKCIGLYANVMMLKIQGVETFVCDCGETVATIQTIATPYGKHSVDLVEQLKADASIEYEKKDIKAQNERKAYMRENGELKAKLKELEAQRKNLQDKLIAESEKIVRLEANIRKLNTINEHMQEVIDELERKINLYDKARS